MINDLLKNIDKIYIAYGVTDFRKQTSTLCGIIKNVFGKKYNQTTIRLVTFRIKN